MNTAKRELCEETGALEFDIEPICIYSVTAPDNLNNGEESFGMLFFADIKCKLKYGGEVVVWNLLIFMMI